MEGRQAAPPRAPPPPPAAAFRPSRRVLFERRDGGGANSQRTFQRRAGAHPTPPAPGLRQLPLYIHGEGAAVCVRLDKGSPQASRIDLPLLLLLLSDYISRMQLAGLPPASHGGASAGLLISRRLLQALPPAAVAPASMHIEAKIVVVLAALLCTLICVVGLALFARCAWTRRYASQQDPQTAPPPPTEKGMDEEAIRALPTIAFGPGGEGEDGRYADCPICLAAFAEGEELRLLPPCGHRFHVACVDPWLGSRSSCPSCRRVLVEGADPAAAAASLKPPAVQSSSAAPSPPAEPAPAPSAEAVPGQHLFVRGFIP